MTPNPPIRRLPTEPEPPPDPHTRLNGDGRTSAEEQPNPLDSHGLPDPANPTDQADPGDLLDLADTSGLADPGHVARNGDEAESFADVGKASPEVREFLARRRRAWVGTCLCQGGGASGADRAPRLLPVEADPLDVKRLESRARLGAILGHCRCEPGTVAA